MRTKKQPTPATPTDQRPTCCECGGHNVETNAWIEYRPDGTAAVANSEGPISDATGNWCHDCDANTQIEFPETTPADDARRQAADAAREAGPELLEVLERCRAQLWALRHHYSEDEQWDAVFAADEMLSRCAPAIRRKN